MEKRFHRYLNFKKSTVTCVSLKKSINWLCLINGNFNKDCRIHKFLIDSERLFETETDE